MAHEGHCLADSNLDDEEDIFIEWYGLTREKVRCLDRNNDDDAFHLLNSWATYYIQHGRCSTRMDREWKAFIKEVRKVTLREVDTGIKSKRDRAYDAFFAEFDHQNRLRRQEYFRSQQVGHDQEPHSTLGRRLGKFVGRTRH